MENKGHQSVNSNDKNETIVSGCSGISNEKNNSNLDCNMETNSKTNDNKTLTKSIHFDHEGTSFTSISEDYEKSRNNDVSKPTREESKISIGVLDDVPEHTIPFVLKKESLSLSMISRIYKDSESDNGSEDSSNDDTDVNDSDNENSIISISSDVDLRSGIKTKGELDIKDLPPIEDLTISVDANKCVPVGNIQNIVDTLVIIEAYIHQRTLNIDSVLFINCGQRALGRIFDVFGPVIKPYYSIRFNNLDHIKQFNIQIKDQVYFAPHTEYASFVMVSKLMQIKGSDASWKDNNEPPPECLDYSDDEMEKLAKKTHKKKKRNKNDSSNTNESINEPNHTNPTDINSSTHTQYSNRHNHNNVRPFPTYAQQLSSIEYSPHRPPWAYNQMHEPRHNQNPYFLPSRFENQPPRLDQMRPTFHNQMQPNFHNQIQPTFHNQMQPTFNYQMQPTFGHQMPPTFGNPWLPTPRLGNQMPPPQGPNPYNMQQMEYRHPNPNFYGNYE